MGIFSRKTKDEKDQVKKTASVKDVKKIDKNKQSMKDLYGGGEKKTEGSKKATDDKKGKNIKKVNAYKVLVKPLITEKATFLAAENKYVFAVLKDANKIEIAKAIYEVYGVEPIKVNIVSVKGKNVRYGRITGKRKDWKKAMITLPKGKSINIYEGV